MVNNTAVQLLLLLITLQIATGAPTLGDDITENMKQNMGAVHGNIMAALTNLLKPFLDLIDLVPNALFGRDLKVAEPGQETNFISKLIMGGVGALNSGIKLASTLISAPFKLAGDGIMALEKVVLGRGETNKEKREVSSMTITQTIESGLQDLSPLDENGNFRRFIPKQGKSFFPTQGKSFFPTQGKSFIPKQGKSFIPKQGKSFFPTQGNTFFPTQGNSLFPRREKRQIKPKFLEGLTETLDKFNDFIAEKANEDGDFLLFLGQLFSRD